MSRVFGFKAQLAVGAAGERRFLAHYQDVRPLDGRRGDFAGNRGAIIELKSDSRAASDTANFFMERFSSVERSAIGGPWQALEHGADYFVYMFSCGRAAWFEVAALVSFLDACADQFEQRAIRNRGWTGLGWLVPQSAVADLIVKLDEVSAYEADEEEIQAKSVSPAQGPIRRKGS